MAILNDNIDHIDYLKRKLIKNNIKIITYGKNNSDINCFRFNKIAKIKIYSKSFFLIFLFFIQL